MASAKKKSSSIDHGNDDIQLYFTIFILNSLQDIKFYKIKIFNVIILQSGVLECSMIKPSRNYNI